MIGLLLLTHDRLGESLVECVEHILSERPEQIAVLGVRAQDEPSEMVPVTQRMVAAVDGGEGVLVLTDIYGATPSNIAAKVLRPGQVEGVAGVGLPMLLRALTHRERDMDTLIRRALAGGCDGVLHMR